MDADEIVVENLKPGMVLAKGVSDKSGNKLLGEGIVIDSKLIDRLKCVGIESVSVTLESSMSHEELGQRRGQIEDELKQRFCGVMDRPLMRKLYETVLAYQIGRLQ